MKYKIIVTEKYKKEFIVEAEDKEEAIDKVFIKRLVERNLGIIMTDEDYVKGSTDMNVEGL